MHPLCASNIERYPIKITWRKKVLFLATINFLCLYLYSSSCASSHYAYLYTPLLHFSPQAPTHVPRSISYEILGATSFLLRWLPPPEEHHHGIIREYRANAVEETSGRVFTLTTPGNTTEVVFENLHPFYLYNCTVAAITVDLGPFSATIGAMTNEAGQLLPSSAVLYFPL